MIQTFAARTLVLLLGLSVVAGAVPRPVVAAPLETVRVGRAVANAFVFAVLEIGEDAGTWERAGLKLDIASFKGDGQMQQAMAAGSLDFGLGSGPAMGYRAKGVPAIAVASTYASPGDMAMIVGASSPIKSMADLKGKKVGVSTSGSLTDWLVHETSRRQGWGSDGIEAIAMGTMEARVAALGSGDIAATVQDVGTGYELEEQHKGRVLQTFGNFVQKFETHVIFASDDIVAKNPDRVTKFLKGWFATVAYMKKNKAATVKSAAKALHESDFVAGKVYDTVIGGMSLDGTWDAASVVAVAKSLKELGIMDAEPDPKTLYTNRFVPVKI